MNPFDAATHDEIQMKLIKDVNAGDWEEVIKNYEENPTTHLVEITSSGDTALHVAVYNGKESAVIRLAAVVWKMTGGSALGKKNELGNTPLHLAAYLGNVEMCRYLAALDSTLMGIRNEDNETPFFVAVRHGRKEAFHEMHMLCGPRVGYRYCRGKEGETILHAAIFWEYFDLAFYIMKEYVELVNAYNEQGFSPLHILANKPSAFRSGSHIRGLQRVIYHCISVDELDLQLNISHKENKEEVSMYPRNCHACVGMLSILWKVIKWLLSEGSTNRMAKGFEFLPLNYTTFSNFIKFISEAVLVILGIDLSRLKFYSNADPVIRLDIGPHPVLISQCFQGFSIGKIREKKTAHVWSVQIMEKLLEYYSFYKYEYNAGAPSKKILLPSKKILLPENCPTPILIAAKNGVVEMVEGILKRFPVAALDMDSEQKNVVLLAVEYRQPHVYQFLRVWQTSMKETMLRKTDKDGNSALHLAASLGKNRPWLIPALQMQWEIKWYELVKNSMPPHFFPRHNNSSETPREIFSKTHTQLAKESGEWLVNTSKSCSVVAALIVTVAFPTFATVPGGFKSDDSGTPSKQSEPAFGVFAISSLVAFCFSVISVVMFLALLTSRFEENDFGIDLPRKLPSKRQNPFSIPNAVSY